jgi:predicted ATPase
LIWLALGPPRPRLSPMSLAVHAKNYRGLVEVDWTIPPGLSVVVGANGAGKTTLLFLLDVLRGTASGGLAAALSLYGGARALKHMGAAKDAAIVLGARCDDIGWQIEPVPMGGGVAAYPAERLLLGGQVLFDHAAESPTVNWRGSNVGLDAGSVLHRLVAADLTGDFPARPLLEALERCRIYTDYDLRQLRQGSEVSPHRSLVQSGVNAFSVLRNWRDWSADRGRYDFVVESLRECFGFFEGFDFQQGGRTVEGWIVHRQHGGSSFPAGHAAEGWFVALLHFTAVAGADPGQIVGIDSFENALHPRALGTAIDLIRDHADAKGISVVLTTQSPQVLDAFGAHPEKVFVLDPRYLPGPRLLTDLRTEEWLAHFRLGRKYADGDFGAEALDDGASDHEQRPNPGAPTEPLE